MPKSFGLLVASLAFFLTFSFSAQAAPEAENFFSPYYGSYSYKKIGDLKPTFYWVAMEQNDGSPRNFPLKDMDGNVLAMVSQRFYSAIRLEGTGKLLDGRVLNYKGRVPTPGGGEEIRYIVCPPSAPYGYGLDQWKLKPFRSVAVDPNVIPIGSKVYIPKARGLRLPDGSVHDGIFEAVDIGDAIQSKRIDMFTAYGDQSSVFARAGIENMKAVAVYLMQ
jgi:3D (Asp-Asp-Asp) domain-containing protein